MPVALTGNPGMERGGAHGAADGIWTSCWAQVMGSPCGGARTLFDFSHHSAGWSSRLPRRPGLSRWAYLGMEVLMTL